MSPQNQDNQDMRQDINQDVKARAYWESGQSGHLARMYRSIFTHNVSVTSPHIHHARARIGLFLSPDCPDYYIYIGFYVLTLVLTHVLIVLIN